MNTDQFEREKQYQTARALARAMLSKGIYTQKSYTVDFLTKKTKVNEGEIPQYYVEENHEC